MSCIHKKRNATRGGRNELSISVSKWLLRGVELTKKGWRWPRLWMDGKGKGWEREEGSGEEETAF